VSSTLTTQKPTLRTPPRLKKFSKIERNIFKNVLMRVQRSSTSKSKRISWATVKRLFDDACIAILTTNPAAEVYDRKKEQLHEFGKWCKKKKKN